MRRRRVADKFIYANDAKWINSICVITSGTRTGWAQSVESKSDSRFDTLLFGKVRFNYREAEKNSNDTNENINEKHFNSRSERKLICWRDVPKRKFESQ